MNLNIDIEAISYERRRKIKDYYKNEARKKQIKKKYAEMILKENKTNKKKIWRNYC
jgi:hypothetical protein